MLGRVVKTTYLLRYLHDAALRDRVHLQLNRGESRHELARRLFFANQGAFRSGDYEEIMNKVSALSVLSNAVLVYGTPSGSQGSSAAWRPAAMSSPTLISLACRRSPMRT
jgi:TnpA family transposase